jgi:hypothetical protein
MKSVKHKILSMKFDAKGVRELLAGESKFITQLLDKCGLPVPGNSSSSGTITLHFFYYHECCIVVLQTFVIHV